MQTATSTVRRSARRGATLVALIAAFLLVAASSAFALTYDPENIISNDNMRAANSMTESQVQAFLETQPGVLKSYVTEDHMGVRRKASSIIWRACQRWQISPKVMLTMLQKEQSLLTRTTLGKNTLSRAIGAGCPDANTNRYPGFGNQMYHGARLLDSYGEGNPSFPTYYEGISKRIYDDAHFGTHLHPKNLATFKLYVYNPSVGAKYPYGDLSAQAGSCTGNANFWLIYRRYFGSTFAHPRMRPVYRFRNKNNGTYLYTASIAERLRLRDRSGTWAYDGPKFSWDTSVPVSATKPMYRFFNRNTEKYSYTSSQETYEYRRSATGSRTWKYGGVAWRVSKVHEYTPKAAVIYRLRNRQTGGTFLTASKETVQTFRTKYAYKWRYEGIAFYLPRYTAP